MCFWVCLWRPFSYGPADFVSRRLTKEPSRNSTILYLTFIVLFMKANKGPKKGYEKVVLSVDGHKNHTSLKSSEFAKEKKILTEGKKDK